MKYFSRFFLILILAIAASISIFTQSAFAETIINASSSEISTDTTWTAANGPYVIYDTPTIEAGATLTIEPGTIIKFDILSGIDVLGTLIADGTADSKIYFTSLMDDSVGEMWFAIDY